MNTRRRNILSTLDNAVRWTGIPARVSDQLSGAPSNDRKHQPLRWIPIWPIAFSFMMFVLCMIWPSVLLTSIGAFIAASAPSIHMKGPLGKSSLEDDEREAALRKDSFLFCFGVMVLLNCAGQVLVLGVALLQGWDTAHAVFVAASSFSLNLTLVGCLPTLYASWRMRRIAME
jgi:hypothetical protein